MAKLNDHHHLYVWQLITDAYEINQVEAIGEELVTFTNIFTEAHQLKSLLKAPGMTFKMKQTLIKEVFEGHFSTLIIDFFMTLVENNLTEELLPLTNIYDQLVKEYAKTTAGVIKGEVWSATNLTDGQMLQLIKTFSQKLNRQVQFDVVVDPSLIGGYKVKINQKVYDHTIKTGLKQLSETLKDEMR